MQQAAPAVPVERGFVGTLIDLWVSPGEAFHRIRERPRVLPPLAGLLLLAVGFTTLWVSRVDPEAVMRAQLAPMHNLTPEQKEQAIDQQAKYIPMMAWAGALVLAPMMWLGAAAIYLGVFKLLGAGDLSFVRSLAVVAWSFLAVDLVQTPLMTGILAAKGDWNVDPNTVLQANAMLLLDSGATPPWLRALVSSFDLFTLWGLFLLASGYAVMSGRRLMQALPGVLGPWVVFVLLKVGWSAFS